jgi:hypothetical protein
MLTFQQQSFSTSKFDISQNLSQRQQKYIQNLPLTTFRPSKNMSLYEKYDMYHPFQMKRIEKTIQYISFSAHFSNYKRTKQIQICFQIYNEKNKSPLLQYLNGLEINHFPSHFFFYTYDLNVLKKNARNQALYHELLQKNDIPEFDHIDVYNQIDFQNMTSIFNHMNIINNNKFILTLEYIEKTITFRHYLNINKSNPHLIEHIYMIVFIIYSVLFKLQPQQFSHNQLTLDHILLQKGHYIYTIDTFTFQFPFRILFSNYEQCSTKISSLFVHTLSTYYYEMSPKNNYTDSYDLLLLQNIRHFLFKNTFQKTLFYQNMIEFLYQIPDDDYFEDQKIYPRYINYIEWCMYHQKMITSSFYTISSVYTQLQKMFSFFHPKKMKTYPHISYEMIKI